MDDTSANRKGRKVKIEIDPDGPEEIVIRTRSMTPEINALKTLIESGEGETGKVRELALRLGEAEYFVPLGSILFFESDGDNVAAHTDRHIYYTDLKLYELEAILPKSFMRVSKACVLNLEAVDWLRRELTGPCRVGFTGCTKQAYVSRLYYRPFREKLEEMRSIIK